MCNAHADLPVISRRSWLTRSAGGLFAIWAGLSLGQGKSGWGVLVGTPEAAAQTVPPTILAASSIIQLPPGNPTGLSSFDVKSFILIRGQEASIVDTLLPGNANAIGEVLRGAGLDYGNVRNVILTHFHGDHTGSLQEVADLAGQATIWAGAPDIPRIQLNRTIRPVREGDEVFGMRIIETPGHTAGHISVLEPASGTLVVGDAATNLGGRIDILEAFAADMGQSVQTAGKIAQLGISRALFAHGEPINQNASASFAALAGDFGVRRFLSRVGLGFGR